MLQDESGKESNRVPSADFSDNEASRKRFECRARDEGISGRHKDRRGKKSGSDADSDNFAKLRKKSGHSDSEHGASNKGLERKQEILRAVWDNERIFVRQGEGQRV